MASAASRPAADARRGQPLLVEIDEGLGVVLGLKGVVGLQVERLGERLARFCRLGQQVVEPGDQNQRLDAPVHGFGELDLLGGDLPVEELGLGEVALEIALLGHRLERAHWIELSGAAGAAGVVPGAAVRSWLSTWGGAGEGSCAAKFLPATGAPPARGPVWGASRRAGPRDQRAAEARGGPPAGEVEIDRRDAVAADLDGDGHLFVARHGLHLQGVLPGRSRRPRIGVGPKPLPLRKTMPCGVSGKGSTESCPGRGMGHWMRLVCPGSRVTRSSATSE